MDKEAARMALQQMRQKMMMPDDPNSPGSVSAHNNMLMNPDANVYAQALKSTAQDMTSPRAMVHALWQKIFGKTKLVEEGTDALKPPVDPNTIDSNS
jgi:hypothetical protein